LIALRIKKERYSWFVISDKLNQGKAVFNSSNRKKKINYRQWKSNRQEEQEITELITTINEFLDVAQNSDDYKSFVANYYKVQGYTVWEYSKDREIPNSEKLNLVLKKSKEIILVQCKNNKINIDKEQVIDFEAQSEAFLGEHQIFKNYNIRLRYTMAGLFLEEDAYEYIKQHSDTIDYDIVKEKGIIA
jgi:hypothetical protein